LLLFRPPGPASAGWAGLYILLLYYRPSRRWPVLYQQYRHSAHGVPFFTGGKMSQILAQISTTIVFGPPYFWTGELYRKIKTKLSGADDTSTIIPNLGWVSPPTPRTIGAMGTPKDKSGKFLYILHSSSPCRVQRHQC